MWFWQLFKKVSVLYTCKHCRHIQIFWNLFAWCRQRLPNNRQASTKQWKKSETGGQPHIEKGITEPLWWSNGMWIDNNLTCVVWGRVVYSALLVWKDFSLPKKKHWDQSAFTTLQAYSTIMTKILSKAALQKTTNFSVQGTNGEWRLLVFNLVIR